MNLQRFLLSVVLVALLLPGVAQAKRFRNAFVSFELPPGWVCKIEGTEWICESEFTNNRAREALIILAAKQVDTNDSLPEYLKYLGSPRTTLGRNGSRLTSKVVHVKERMIANHMWIDGMHMASEVGSYFTRYVATVKDKVTLLVTFTAHKDHFTKYSGDFIRAVESLRIVFNKESLGNQTGYEPKRGAETIGAPIGQNIPSFESEILPPEGSGSKNKNSTWLVIGLLIAAVAGYALIKLKGKNRK